MRENDSLSRDFDGVCLTLVVNGFARGVIAKSEVQDITGHYSGRSPT